MSIDYIMQKLYLKKKTSNYLFFFLLILIGFNKTKNDPTITTFPNDKYRPLKL